jgi:hypothetical protein
MDLDWVPLAQEFVLPQLNFGPADLDFGPYRPESARASQKLQVLVPKSLR